MGLLMEKNCDLYGLYGILGDFNGILWGYNEDTVRIKWAMILWDFKFNLVMMG